MSNKLVLIIKGMSPITIEINESNKSSFEVVRRLAERREFVETLTLPCTPNVVLELLVANGMKLEIEAPAESKSRDEALLEHAWTRVRSIDFSSNRSIATRIRHGLINTREIEYIWQLVQVAERDTEAWKNFGSRCFTDMSQCLATMGLATGMKADVERLHDQIQARKPETIP